MTCYFCAQIKNMMQGYMRNITSGYKTLFYFFCGCAFLLTACNNNGSSTRKAPDVSEVKAEIKTVRLDLEMANIDSNHVGEGLAMLHNKYPDFFDFYIDTIMGLKVNGNYTDTAINVRKGVKPFLTNSDFRGLFDTLKKHFPDTKAIDADLDKGFKYMKHYFPNYKTPKVYYITTMLFNKLWAFTAGDSTVGIGLDMYLGENYPFYKAPTVDIPDYMNPHLRPSYVPVALFTSIYENMHPFEMADKTLLDMIVQRGKEQYFLHQVLPFISDTTLFGYSEKQLKWCETHEADVYNFFIKQNLLYSSEFQTVIRYVMDGPNSSGMPIESPGNIGSWLGYRIALAYVSNTGTDMNAVLKAGDPVKFLTDSKYKPR